MARVVKNGPLRFIERTLVQVFVEVVEGCSGMMMLVYRLNINGMSRRWGELPKPSITPAQLTRMSMVLNFSTTALTAVSTESSEETSHLMSIRLALLDSSGGEERSRLATLAPKARKEETVAAPMPEFPPVTTATCVY